MCAERGDETVPMIIFVGDGVSDLHAAREAVTLFIHGGQALEKPCIKHGIWYIPYHTFADIEREVYSNCKSLMTNRREARVDRLTIIRKTHQWRASSSSCGTDLWQPLVRQ